jgi:dUTP pyrophosphatase
MSEESGPDARQLAGGAGSLVRVGVERIDASCRDLELPSYATRGAAGLDLRAAVGLDEALEIPPGGRALVPTGLRLAIPEGYEGQVRPRSGLALKFGVTVLNAPGTIDSDYRGELKVLLVNHGEAPFVIRRGERIAQIVFAAVAQVALVEAAVDETARGAGGFGHTGRG